MHFIKKIKQTARGLKSEVNVLVIAYKDERTPLAAKLLIGITVGYLLSPIDLIPDFIPVLGFLDDLILLPILISASIKLIPPIVLSEARQHIKDNPDNLRKKNWVFAVLIILIWVLLFYLFYRHFQHSFKREK